MYFIQLDIAIYSASAELSAIIVCHVEVHETGFPLSVIRIPVVAHLSSLHPAKSALV